MKSRGFPFVPRSSLALQPGDFWSIPISDGSFACGRVVELLPKGMAGERVLFLGGLLDWHASSLPTAVSIAGVGTLKQGIMHIKAITSSGGEVLGHRPLALDNLEPATFVHGNDILRGFTRLRAWRRDDTRRFPTLSWWGYDVIQSIAQQQFLGHVPRNA